MRTLLFLSGILFASFLTNAQTPTLQSLIQNTAGTQTNEIYNIAKDANGNTFFCGRHLEDINFGGVSLPTGQGNSFWGKVDNSGNVIWLKQGGTNTPVDKALGIAVDQNENVYVCGQVANYQVPAFGGIPLSSMFYHGFVVKYSNTGNLIWAKGMTGVIYSIAIDNTNTPVVNVGDSFIQKLNPADGKELDFGTSISASNQNPQWHNILIDASNNIIVQAGNKIIKFDSSYNQLWSTPVTSSLMETFRISLDQSGNVYGTFYALFGTVTVGTVTKSSFPNGYIYKLDATSGTPLFVDAFLIGGNASKIKEVIPSGGNYYVSGDGAFNTAVVLKTTSSYDLLWQKNLSSKTPINDIALNSNDCLILAGSHKGTVALDAYNLVPPSGMGNTIANGFLINLCAGALGIVENSVNFKNVQVFPNPSNGVFNIQINQDLMGAKATIYNLLGQKIKDFSLKTANTNQTLNKGIYLLEIEKEANKTTKKLIIN